MEEKINKGCEFQNDCIEYKDISYLKNMPICAIYELSIACHNKENKCKYYKLYKQLKQLKQENEKLKNTLKDIDKKLELALDVEQTDAEESFNLLYEIQETITKSIGK